MISNTELAKKWNLPVSEMNKIVTFADKYHFDVTRAYKMYRTINRAFEANVIKNQKTQKYYGVLYLFDNNRQVQIIALSQGFDTPSNAAKAVNECIPTKKLDWKTCYRLGVIPEARQLIKPVNEDRFQVGQKSVSVSRIQATRGGRSE